MTKQEVIKMYYDGLEKSLNHPLLLNNRQAKDMMKDLCTTAFELGWDASLISTGQVNEGEIDDMNQKLKEKLSHIKQKK